MERIRIGLPDGHLSALRFGAASSPLRLIFCHANGFNAQTYRAVLQPLVANGQGHILALDLRGHGRTDLPTDPDSLTGWQIFADDIANVFEAVVTDPVILAGHSYGAVSAILALSQIQDRISGYVGFDPVLVPRLFGQLSRLAVGRAYMKRRIPIARKAGQRKSVFDDLDAAFARYQGRGAFQAVPDAVLHDYLKGGLVPMADGQMHLACNPQWEQAIFVAQAHNVFRNIARLPDNSRIIFAGARGQVSTQGQRAKLARLQKQISVEFEKDRSHLFPLEDPPFATEVLRSVMAEATA